MIATFIWIRDALVAAALAWVGVSVEPAREPPCPQGAGPAASCGQGALSFSTDECAKRH